MRRIHVPKSKQGSQVEDIRIQFYDNDKEGNLFLRHHTIEIPMGLGKFAAAAMGLGWIEKFDQRIEETLGVNSGAGDFAKSCELLLNEFDGVLKRAKANLEKQQAAQQADSTAEPLVTSKADVAEVPPQNKPVADQSAQV